MQIYKIYIDSENYWQRQDIFRDLAPSDNYW
jgi:hypothetical protein